MDGEGPKNEAPKRIDPPVFTGKLHIFLVPAPEDGPGMYRFVERHDQIPRRELPPAGPATAQSPQQENDPYLSIVLGTSAASGDDLAKQPQHEQRRGRRL